MPILRVADEVFGPMVEILYAPIPALCR
jgi:hypothetical protein